MEKHIQEKKLTDKSIMNVSETRKSQFTYVNVLNVFKR